MSCNVYVSVPDYINNVFYLMSYVAVHIVRCIKRYICMYLWLFTSSRAVSSKNNNPKRRLHGSSHVESVFQSRKPPEVTSGWRCSLTEP